MAFSVNSSATELSDYYEGSVWGGYF